MFNWHHTLELVADSGSNVRNKSHLGYVLCDVSNTSCKIFIFVFNNISYVYESTKMYVK